MHDSLCRTALVVGALLAVFVLSGCTNGGDDPEEGIEGMEDPDGGQDPDEHVQGIGPDFVVLMNPVHASGCRSVEAVVEVPESHASSLLPDGFVPAPGPSGMNAALVLEVLECEGSETEEAGAGYARVWLGVHVEKPVLPAPAEEYQKENRTHRDVAQEAVDLYVVAAYTDGRGFQRFLRQSGIPYELAWVDLEFTQTADALIVQAGVEDRDNGEVGLQLAAPTAAVAAAMQHRTAWASTNRGVQAFEELHHGEENTTVAVHQGTGVCAAREGLFVDPLGPQGCAAPGVRASSGFQVTGYSLWFHDTKVLG